MPTLNVSTTAYIVGIANQTFNTARTSNGATIINGATGTVASPVEYRLNTARGGGGHRMTRTYLDFNTSGISGTVSAATLNIASNGANNGDIIGLKTTAFGSGGGGNLAASSFYSTISYGTPYTAEISTWSAGAGKSAANNAITLNAAARSDMQNNNRFQIAFVNHTYDYANSAASSTLSEGNAIAFNTTINIDYTISAASGYANDVMGVATANIGKVFGVATANVSKVIGV